MHSQARAFSQPTRANIHQYQFNNPIIFCKYPATYRIFNKNCFVKYLLLLKQNNKISICLFIFSYSPCECFLHLQMSRHSFPHWKHWSLLHCDVCAYPIENIKKNRIITFWSKFISGKVTKCAKLFGH